MRSETQRRRRRASEKATKRALQATPHLPGDRWQHDSWPKGGPDAVTGHVEFSYVAWAERGGSAAPGVPTRLLTPGNGWRKVGVASTRSPSFPAPAAPPAPPSAPAQTLVPWRGATPTGRKAVSSARAGGSR